MLAVILVSKQSEVRDEKWYKDFLSFLCILFPSHVMGDSSDVYSMLSQIVLAGLILVVIVITLALVKRVRK